MNFKKYMDDASRTLAPVADVLGKGKGQELHMILGIVTEAGELADAYKKDIAYNKPVDMVNVKEEIGDIMWYIGNLCKLQGWDLQDICDTNIAKLRTRYPDKFTEEAALNRDLKSERKILEKGDSDGK